MLSITELAHATRCSVGEASKRVKQADVDGFVGTHRSGRKKLVALHRVSSEQWQEIVASAPPAAVSLYRLALRRTQQAAAPAVVHSAP